MSLKGKVKWFNGTKGELNVDCYEFIIGCTDSDATNYDPDANADDGSCEYSTTSCILGDIYVSEAANRGDPDDYIEVYNNGSEECTLAGFQLDDAGSLISIGNGNGASK